MKRLEYSYLEDGVCHICSFWFPVCFELVQPFWDGVLRDFDDDRSVRKLGFGLDHLQSVNVTNQPVVSVIDQAELDFITSLKYNN